MNFEILDIRPRLRAAMIHLGLSALIAAAAAVLVLVLWYPMPYREISGGRELFLLVVSVDVVLGPLITFAIFDRRKPSSELMRDLGVVVALQLVALGYGLHTVAQARPAVIALEGDRLRVVRAIDLDEANLRKAPPGLQSLSWCGPLTVAARPPLSEEKFDAIQRALAGEDIGMRPEFWRAPAETGSAYSSAAAPLAHLKVRRPSRSTDLRRAIEATGRSEDQLGYLPILARRTDWSALVDRRTGEVVGYVDIEGF
jgi:hypothetical protein